MAKRGPQVSVKSAVAEPIAEPMIPVPLSTWRRFVEKIKIAGAVPIDYSPRGWFFLGTGTALLTAAITFPFSVQFTLHEQGLPRLNWPAVLTEGLFVLAGGISIGYGQLALGFDKAAKKWNAWLAQQTAEEMEAFEQRHQLPSA